MDKRHKQASTYLELVSYESITAIARRNGRSLSTHLRHVINREIRTGGTRPEDVLKSLEYIQIAVDALLKNHPNTKLFEVVTAVRNADKARASHEA